MKHLFLFLSMAMMMAACREDEKETVTPQQPEPTELEKNKAKLTAGRWQVEKVETIILLSGDSMRFDVTSSIQGCDTDNSTEYHSSGFVKNHKGEFPCYSGEPVLDTTRRWVMDVANQIKETNIATSVDQFWNIELLTDNELRISSGLVDTNGNQCNIVTFTHIQ